MPTNTEKTETLVVYDENLKPIGTRTRADVHANALLHQTIRLWCVENDKIWFQQRSPYKSLFPNRFDLAATGHIDPGESPDQAALRETSEETGLNLKLEDLTKAGAIPFPFMRPDGKLDNEFANLYLHKPDTTPVFKTNDEVAGLGAMSLENYDKLLKTGQPVEIGLYTPDPNGKKPPVKTGTKLCDPDDFCCLNPNEWNLIQAALKQKQAGKSLRNTDDMPVIESENTTQPELEL